MGGKIRASRLEDVDALLAIQGTWPSLPRWTRAHFESEVAGERGRLFVFESDGRPAAFAALRLVRPEAEITVVAVEPGHLRRGIARRLLKRLHEAAAEAGCSIIGLEVSAKNASAIALYASTGYRVVGRRPKYYNDGSDALLMSLRLP